MTAAPPDFGDLEDLAIEYVLGTLDGDERAATAARAGREPLLAAAIADWQKRLAPLDEMVAPVAPSPDLLRRIEARLTRNPTSAVTVPPLATPPAAPPRSADVIAMESRLRRWRRIGMTASALAACLAIAIGLRETVLAPRPQNFVAVFQKDDVLPSFLLTIDLATRQLTIRPVAAEPQDGKTYQLWIASDRLGPARRSLGLLEEAKAPTRKSLAAFAPDLLAKATFGVSIEPTGGSPTGRPSGNPLHAKLYPAAPEAP